MNTLVIHHTYMHGLTFDISNHRNHGIPIAVNMGSGPFLNSFDFSSGDSRIMVEPSPSLNDLRAIRTSVRFYHRPTEGGRRYNLIEGHVSFVLVIGADRSLAGGIVDANGNWSTISSAPDSVIPEQWYEAELRHDGVNHCQLSLDGNLVATSYSMHGPVRSVGNYGIAIGAWPDYPPPYTFQGYIGEVQLYKYDPKQEIRQLIDPCCIDRETLYQAIEQLRKGGWDGTVLGNQADQLMQIALQVALAVRADDPTQTEEHQRNGAEAVAAFLYRDAPGLRAALGRLSAQILRNLTPAQLADFAQQTQTLVERMPFTLEEFKRLARALCWEHGIVEDQSTEEADFPPS